MKSRFLIGIDEVGRGPIAGPVAVGVFLFLKKDSSKLFKSVKESKQLSEAKREEWFKKILEIQKNGDIDFVVTFQSEKVIDTKGLSFAIKNALKISINKLIKKHKIKYSDVTVLLDGGLKAPAEYINQKTIIKGDEKEKVIALTSICAKVLRDRKMRKWAVKYPGYGFEVNKGYGTRGHYKGIRKGGVTAIHRRSFLRKISID